MTDGEAPIGRPFGELKSRGYGRFGTISGGALGGGLPSLLDEIDRERGFFGKRDRRYILTANWDDALTDSTERNTRHRIRSRILTAFFDARYLQFTTAQDRKIVMRNARDAGYDLHFREGFKEFIRFTYLGLLELETNVEINEIIEHAVEAAHKQYAISEGRPADFDAELVVSIDEGRDIEELEERYANHDTLSRDELAALVNSRHHTMGKDGVNAADIDLADALLYDARQPESAPHADGWEEPSRKEAEAIVLWLRDLFDEYGVETYQDLEVAVDRLLAVEEDLGGELNSKLSRLPRVAPNFEEQISTDILLPHRDSSLLNDLFSRREDDLETTLNQEVRPRTAGDEWSPVDDEYLHRFIARVEAARDLGNVFPPHESTRARWNDLLELAEFDRSEWRDYMRQQRITLCARQLERLAEEHQPATENLKSADSWEELAELLPQEATEPLRQLSGPLEHSFGQVLDELTELRSGAGG